MRVIVGKLVDTQDLGSCGFAVGVRVPPPVPEFLKSEDYMIVKEEKSKGEKLAKQFVFTTFDNNDIKEATKQACEHYKNTKNIKGFRKGIVPDNVIKQRYKERNRKSMVLSKTRWRMARKIRNKN